MRLVNFFSILLFSILIAGCVAKPELDKDNPNPAQTVQASINSEPQNTASAPIQKNNPASSNETEVFIPESIASGLDVGPE